MATGRILSDRYLIGDLIGQGAMGLVYNGTDLTTGQMVAIKELRPEVSAREPGFVGRFTREGEALRRLNHPNIIKLYASLEENGAHFLVMEYLECGTLRDLLDAEPQPPLEHVLNIALNLSDALTRAHHLGIIHRDLKPGNIMLADDGSARLADFGIARFVDSTSATQEGSIMGTWAYLSPEAYLEMPLDSRSDIWSFGVILFEMLGGQRPFMSNTPAGLVTAILNYPFGDLSALRPDLPDALVDLVYRMLAKNRTERIVSVRLVGAEIEALQQRLGLVAAEPSVIAAARVVGPSSNLAFKTPTPATGKRHNLPAQAIPFVGREDILARLGEMLDDSACRLITLLGPGGIGKTRISIELALRRLNRYEHGAFFVPLAPLNTPEKILWALAESIGFPFAREGDPHDQVMAYLRDKQMLLVLDNFEHLVEGAGLISEILQAAPGITFLATSRFRLNLQEEFIFEIGGMDIPDGQGDGRAFEDYEAVRLFVEYARRVRPGYTLDDEDKPAIVSICHRVGGVPLGIGLAAAWVRMLSPDEVAREFERGLDALEATAHNVPDRQRSMRAAFDYSWNLLSPEERAALKRLSVFRGRFTREAAQEISGAPVSLLMALTDKSLLHRNPYGLFEIHEMIRQFAAQRLEEDPQEMEHAHHAHWHYYADFLHRREADIKGPCARQGLEAIERDFPNIRAAWDWAVETKHFDPMGDTLISLHQFSYASGLEREEVGLYKNALAALPDPLPDPLRLLSYQLRALLVGSGVDYGQRREHMITTLPDILDQHLERDLGWLFPQIVMASSTYLHELGEQKIRDTRARLIALIPITEDRWLRGLISMAVGNITIADLHEIEEGKTYLREALATLREIDERFWRGWLLGSLADWARYEGDYATAEMLYSEAYMLARDIGDRPLIANVLWRLGRNYAAQGDYGQAEEKLAASIALGRHVGLRESIVVPLYLMGTLLAVQGRFDEAWPHLDESYTLLEDKNPELMGFCRYNQAFVALRQGNYSKGKTLAEDARAWLKKAGHTDWWIAESQLGEAALGLGDLDTAAGHFRTALRTSIGAVALRHDIPRALIGYAALLKDQGEFAAAVEMIALALAHRSIFYHDRLSAGMLLASLQACLPPDAFEAAKARGAVQTVEGLIRGWDGVFP